MQPTLSDKKAKKEEEVNRKLFSKVLSKKKLKQSNSVDPMIFLPTTAPIISTKKRGLNNLDVPWNSCKTCKYLNLMPKSWQKDVKSNSAIDFQEWLYIHAVYMYFCHVFGICDKHLLLIARRMQLKIILISGILKIRLDIIWDTHINS